MKAERRRSLNLVRRAQSQGKFKTGLPNMPLLVTVWFIRETALVIKDTIFLNDSETTIRRVMTSYTVRGEN